MRFLRAALCSVPVLSVVACSSFEGEPNPETLHDESADNPVAPQSVAGDFVTTMLPMLDGCEIGLDLEEAEIFEIVVSDGGSRFVIESAGDDADCMLDEDDSFACLFEAYPLLPEMKTTLIGRFDGPNTFIGTLATEIECEGESCSELTERLLGDKELPCESVAMVAGTRAQSDDFNVSPGTYRLGLEAAIPDVSTCESDTLGAIPEIVMLATSEDGFTLDGGFTPFDCLLEEGGAMDCTREIEALGLTYEARAVGAFVSESRAIGALRIDVRCAGEGDDCAAAEEQPGSLPCETFHALGLEPAN